MSLTAFITIRSASSLDYDAIEAFLKKNLIVHSHLDWRQPIEWIGHSPCLMLEKDKKITGLLMCPAEIKDIYWIRLFAVPFGTSPKDAFRLLFTQALTEIHQMSSQSTIASIAFQHWMKNLLVSSGWEKFQEVVQLRWRGQKAALENNHERCNFSIRKMKAMDIPTITCIDHTCFESIWQHSEDTIERSYEQAAYSTVAEKAGIVVGYQISTAMGTNAHIARLAVLPEYQRQGVGQSLIHDMLLHFKKPWIREITVNTQKDNYKSLGLYTKIGFEPTSDGFPIFRYRE